MVQLSQCNTLIVGSREFALKYEKPSEKEFTFEGSGGSDALDQSNVTIHLTLADADASLYTGKYKIEYPKEENASLRQLEGPLKVTENAALNCFSLMPRDSADGQIWTLKRV